jgi:hypothetical protein
MQFVAFTVSIDGTSKVVITQTGRKWTSANDQAQCATDLADAAVVRNKYVSTSLTGSDGFYKIDELHACVVIGCA